MQTFLLANSFKCNWDIKFWLIDFFRLFFYQVDLWRFVEHSSIIRVFLTFLFRFVIILSASFTK